jgi:heme exporter protein D
MTGDRTSDAVPVPPAKRVAVSVALVATMLMAAGAIAYRLITANTNLVGLQWADSGRDAMAVVAGHVPAFRRALLEELLVVVPCLVVGLVLGCRLGARVCWTTNLRRLSASAAWVAIAAGTACVVQDAILLVVVGRLSHTGVWAFRAAAAASFVKFSLTLVAAPFAIAAILTTLSRAATSGAIRARWTAAANATWERMGHDPSARATTDLAVGPPPVESDQADDVAGDGHWWSERILDPARAHWEQATLTPDDQLRGSLGICVSGGGIRSATVALGALQSLQAAEPVLPSTKARTELSRATFLSSVSGGGFTAGAYQTVLHAGGTTPEDVLAPGSPEEDHVRRHSSYLADSALQWLSALGVLFRCVVIGVVMFIWTAVVIGIGFNWLYDDIPIIGVSIHRLRPLFSAPTGSHAPSWPVIPWGVALAILGAIALTALAYLLGAVTPSERAAFRRLQHAGTFATLLLVTVGIVVPGTIWFSSWISFHAGITKGAFVAAASVMTTVSYAGALAATLWRHRARLTPVARFPGVFSRMSGQVLPTSMVQRLLLWLSMLFLIFVGLMIAGWVGTSHIGDHPLAGVPVGLFILIGASIDDSLLSAYPYYRRRLASAFAVERRERHGVPVAGSMADVATPLTDWAGMSDGFPESRFVTTANVSGERRTPPGRNAVPYVLTANHVGGPQIGWARTDFLAELSSTVIARELDVQSAVAISGSAFASAMGSATRFFQTYLALTNVRLGAWLPNPGFVALKLRHLDDWTVPGLPSRRRLQYWFREIFNLHPASGRLLLCTDGGHYDNLGLVDLLRLGCTQIYAIDASGGGFPFSDTLAGALQIAKEELGVTVSLDDAPSDLVPGAAQPPPFDPQGPVAAWNARISSACVITGTIHYPSGTSGVLVYAQAALTADLPFEVLEYAQNDLGFPRDKTSDQFFDVGQFDAYQGLGRYLGESAVAAARRAFPRRDPSAEHDAAAASGADAPPRVAGVPVTSKPP